MTGEDVARVKVAMTVVLLAILVVSLWVAFRNYRECRAAGFSRVYCATEHLIG